MDDATKFGFRQRPLWLLGVLGLVLAQAGLALSLFDGQRSWTTVFDERPILSGRHPLHQYHGTLGASSFRNRTATTSYDPSFQAGYPKTPVFDGGCRPAELFFSIGGTRPSVYKMGLFVGLMLIPLAFVLAARGVGLPVESAILAGALGVLLGWTTPVWSMLHEGELDFLAAGLGAIVLVAWLVHYARAITPESCIILALLSAAGWYAHPIVWGGLWPVVIGYYLVLAPRRGLDWHLGLIGVSAAGLAPNLWWLTDWGRYWWLRQPSNLDHIPIPDWTIILGTPHDYAVLFGCVPSGMLLGIAGLVGLLFMWRDQHRGAVGLLLGSILLTTAIARLLATWSRVPVGGPERLVPLTAGFLILPTAYGLGLILHRLKIHNLAAAGSVCLLLILGWADGPQRPLATALKLNSTPLVLGFSPEQETMISVLREHTTPEARILWEDTTDLRPGWNWTALLPLLTERAYLGGLDHESGVEHSYCGMIDGKLNGRSLSLWSDAELLSFARWYNVGWVVCRSKFAIERWSRLPHARPIVRVPGDGLFAVVFALDRPHSFILSGSAIWEEARPNRISLTNVVPDASGGVTLSLHYADGLRVYPSYIRLNSTPDPADPINHIRLEMPGPVPRVTIAWENP